MGGQRPLFGYERVSAGHTLDTQVGQICADRGRLCGPSVAAPIEGGYLRVAVAASARSTAALCASTGC
jgi:hypothetical protein